MIFNYWAPWDKNIFFAFQKIHSPFLDCLLGFPTLLGDTFFLLSVLTVLIFFLDHEQAARKITFVVFALLATYWAVEFLKCFFERPRPYELWEGVVLTFGTARSPAFPSGHTAAAFAAACILNKLYDRKISWLYVIAGWVGVTRIYTGVHYPTDVLGGATIGILCSALAGAILDRTIAVCKR